MVRRGWIAIIAIAALASLGMAANKAVDVPAVEISGKITHDDGKAVRGATVTAFTADGSRSVSVYSKDDGTFKLTGLPMGDYKLRSRLLGLHDATKDLGHVHDRAEASLQMTPAEGLELQAQRPGNAALDLLKFDNEADANNFRMMCTYCHQVGTAGFRSPEEPVDWEVMLTRMDGFQGLYKHTQETLVDRVVEVYGRDAEKKWPAYVPPEPPKGKALEAEVREWIMGKENDAVIHDLELGKDGIVYTVDMTADAIETLDPRTGERNVYSIPGGKDYNSPDPPIKGPHSLEPGHDGNMYVTLALSGEMGMFDVEKKTWRVVSAAPAPRKRAGYPHTLRTGLDGTIWWTDAALGVYSFHPDTYDAEANTYDVKFYKLPDANQVRGGGARGESRGVTPYGIDVSPVTGHIFYSKLNGQRVGRIIPELAMDDPNKIVEWQPPVHGPRRLHVAPNGLVWVPGWASGDLVSFDPTTEEWGEPIPMPAGPSSLPYALNIEPKTGHVWITGTGTDSLLRYDPKAKEFTEFRMPTRVTYTREIEFDDQGGVWTVNSNAPIRHVENAHGSVIHLRTF